MRILASSSTCMNRCKVALIAFVCFFFTVDFKMYPQNCCEKEGIFRRNMFYNYWKGLLLFHCFLASHLFYVTPCLCLTKTSCWQLPLLFHCFHISRMIILGTRDPCLRLLWIQNPTQTWLLPVSTNNPRKHYHHCHHHRRRRHYRHCHPQTWLLILVDCLTLNWVILVSSFWLSRRTAV